MFVFQFIILIYSVILHELAHGYAAEQLGDPTARLSNRLTLDPRPHIDLFTTILLPLFLTLTGGPVFGAAKPVPVDPFNFRDPKKDMAIVSAAGPFMNLFIALIFALIFRSSLFPFLSPLLIYGMQINVFLAVFNLLPIPPLDGFKVLAGIMSNDIAEEMYRLERYGFTIIFAILFFFPGLINRFISPISTFLIRLLVP